MMSSCVSGAGGRSFQLRDRGCHQRFIEHEIPKYFRSKVLRRKCESFSYIVKNVIEGYSAQFFCHTLQLQEKSERRKEFEEGKLKELKLFHFPRS